MKCQLLLIVLPIMFKNLSNVYYRKKDSNFSLCFESSLALAHKCDLNKRQLIFGFLISILSDSSSLRTEQPKQLPNSKHIFWKKSSSLHLTSSISKGIWPIIYPLWQGYGNTNSCSQVKLGTDVPALKPALVLNNFWWDLNSGVLPFSWDKAGTQTWLVLQAQLMGRNSVTISPVPIASGTALTHLSHKPIRPTSQRKENFKLEEGSQQRGREKTNFSIVLETNWVFRFLRSFWESSSYVSFAGLSSYLEFNPSLWSSHPVCKVMSLKLRYICVPLCLSSDLWHKHRCSWYLLPSVLSGVSA